MELELRIKFDTATKDCQVAGPVNSPDICYLGLALARKVIEQYQKKRVVVAANPKVVNTIHVPNLRNLLRDGT